MSVSGLAVGWLLGWIARGEAVYGYWALDEAEARAAFVAWHDQPLVDQEWAAIWNLVVKCWNLKFEGGSISRSNAVPGPSADM